MERYITLIRFTDKGLHEAIDSVERAEGFRQDLAARNGRVIDIYWTLGGWDGAVIFEAPSAEDAAAALLSLGARGYVHAKTMRAFNESEFLRILATAEL